MNGKVKKAVITTAALIGFLNAPVIPTDLEYKYAYQMDANNIPETYEIVTATSTIVKDHPASTAKDKDGNGVISIAVFEDNEGNEVHAQINDAVYEAMGKKGGSEHNPKKTEYQTVIDQLVSVEEAQAAIAYDTSGVVTFTNSITSVSTTFTTGSNSNRYLATGFLTNRTVSSVQYNGSSLTLLENTTSPGGVPIYLYGMVAPDSGSHNLVITIGSSGYIGGTYVTYDGVDQSTPVEASKNETEAASATVSTTLTSLTDGAHAVAYWRDDLGRTVSANNASTTVFAEQSGVGSRSARSNGPIITAGSFTLSGLASVGTPTWGEVMIILKPFSAGGGGDVNRVAPIFFN